MSTYLPKDGSGGSAYQEGGGLFALGNYCWIDNRVPLMDFLKTQAKEL